MRVVAFTGMPGSGKSEAVAVAQRAGMPIVTMGDLVRAETRRRGLELADVNVGRVASEMRDLHGKDYWARRTCEAILRDHATAPVVVVDGVRNPEEVEAFRALLSGHFQLVAVVAGTRSRADRLMRRGRPDDPAAHGDAERRDERELGWGIARAIALSDQYLVNDGNLETFRKSVADLLGRLPA